MEKTMHKDLHLINWMSTSHVLTTILPHMPSGKLDNQFRLIYQWTTYLKNNQLDI